MRDREKRDHAAHVTYVGPTITQNPAVTSAVTHYVTTIRRTGALMCHKRPGAARCDDVRMIDIECECVRIYRGVTSI